MASPFHVGLTVSDLDRSVAFYRRVLGMELRSVTEVDSDAFGRLTANPGARLRTALLGSGDFLLQLVEYTAGGGAVLELDHRHVGSPHLSFWVDDAAARRTELLGWPEVRVTSELASVVPGIRSFYVADPDGVPVELIERGT
ncbi:MAG: VOC family protein [Acidimicrobiales bacterium]